MIWIQDVAAYSPMLPFLQCCLFSNVAFFAMMPFSTILPFFQENWFHDCDNEHAKITAFFQVIRKGMRIITHE